MKSGQPWRNIIRQVGYLMVMTREGLSKVCTYSSLCPSIFRGKDLCPLSVGSSSFMRVYDLLRAGGGESDILAFGTFSNAKMPYFGEACPEPYGDEVLTP
jgi:hypothetical protein